MRAAFILSLVILVSGWSYFTSALPSTEAELGEKLFSDPILSSDRTISCASCHIPEFAFSDTAALSRGVEGRTGTRNTPSVMNQSARTSFFWDGRSATLAEQALQPITNPLEMNLPVDSAIARLKKDPFYLRAFRRIYGQDPAPAFLGKALAAFEKTLETSSSPFDRWMNDLPGGMSDAAVRGRTLFMNKGKCFDCHSGPDFTNDEFRNIGLFNGRDLNDSGRIAISRDPEDLGRFRVPGLRNVAVTGPYMHNGMFSSLLDVVKYYNNPGHFVPDGVNADPLLLEPLGLTEEEEKDIVAFLEALTDDRFSRTVRKTD